MAIPQDASPILYILIDVDDTVYPTSEPLPQGFHQNLDTLSQFIEYANEDASPPIGFCTGRELNYIIGATRSLTSPNAWSIMENGICLYNLATGARINHPLLTREVESVFQEIRSRIPQITQRFPVFEPYLRKEVNIALEKRYPQIDLADYVDPVTEILSEFAEFIDIRCSGHALDIMAKGINKGSATMELCRWADITPEKILSIGDSPNDFAVMELAGYVGCPSNATEECKQFVASKQGYVSPYPFVVGVVDTIEHYLPQTN